MHPVCLCAWLRCDARALSPGLMKTSWLDDVPQRASVPCIAVGFLSIGGTRARGRARGLLLSDVRFLRGPSCVDEVRMREHGFCHTCEARVMGVLGARPIRKPLASPTIQWLLLTAALERCRLAISSPPMPLPQGGPGSGPHTGPAHTQTYSKRDAQPRSKHQTCSNRAARQRSRWCRNTSSGRGGLAMAGVKRLTHRDTGASAGAWGLCCTQVDCKQTQKPPAWPRTPTVAHRSPA